MPRWDFFQIVIKSKHRPEQQRIKAPDKRIRFLFKRRSRMCKTALGSL